MKAAQPAPRRNANDAQQRARYLLWRPRAGAAEPLIFERSNPGTVGVDLPDAPDAPNRLGALARKGPWSAGAFGAAGGAPLHPPQPHELWHRYGPLSAWLLHHEAQSAPERTHGPPARASRTYIQCSRSPPYRAALEVMQQVKHWLSV